MKTIKLLLISSIFMLTSACGTVAYVPKMHQLSETDIADFPVNGSVDISAGQASETPQIVYTTPGIKLQSDYKSVTDLMVQQALLELQRHGKGSEASAETSKSIELSVYYMTGRDGAYTASCDLNYNAKLGNGEEISNKVTYTVGFLVGPHTYFNGCIADAVVNLFQDSRVLSYLAE